MKRKIRKNQVIIAALAVMIAAAGYLNYSGRIFGGKDDAAQTANELANQELLDISDEELDASGEIASQDSEATDGTAARERILRSASLSV